MTSVKKSPEQLLTSLLAIADLELALRKATLMAFPGDHQIGQVARAMAGSTDPEVYKNYYGRANSFLRENGALTRGKTLTNLTQALKRQDLGDAIHKEAEGCGDRYISLTGHGREIVKFSFTIQDAWRSHRETLGGDGPLCTAEIFGEALALTCGRPEWTRNIVGVLNGSTEATTTMFGEFTILISCTTDKAEELKKNTQKIIEEKRLTPARALREKILRLEKQLPGEEVVVRVKRLGISPTSYQNLMSLRPERIPQSDVIAKLNTTVDRLLEETPAKATGATTHRSDTGPISKPRPMTPTAEVARSRTALSDMEPATLDNIADGQLVVLIEVVRQFERLQEARKRPLSEAQRFNLAKLVVGLIELGKLDEETLVAALGGLPVTDLSSPVMRIFQRNNLTPKKRPRQ